MNFTTSKQLIKNTKNFLNLKHYSILDRLFSKSGIFYGWGRKRSGLKAVSLAKKYNTSFVLLEDGFIRSLGLGVDGSPSFSLVEDDVGIYYDAKSPSKLENILNSYDFSSDVALMAQAKEAIELIRKYNISKYNNAPEFSEEMALKYHFQEEQKRVLVIAQTAGDASLKYGMLEHYSTDEMVQSAIDENLDAKVYIKIHPDVLSGKKKSDIDLEKFKKHCEIITENINPISLLRHFDKVYTKTSGMGFEALLVGCECVCFGMPFYAGWGVTDDKTVCKRRKRALSVEEIFAGAYILYSRYYNPYTKNNSDIFDTIEQIVRMRK
jgi:capsular polysaccharide export protein